MVGRWVVIGVAVPSGVGSHHLVTYTGNGTCSLVLVQMLRLAGVGFKCPGDTKKGNWGDSLSFALSLPKGIFPLRQGMPPRREVAVPFPVISLGSFILPWSK